MRTMMNLMVAFSMGMCLASAEEEVKSLDFEQRINGKVMLEVVEPIRERLQQLTAVFYADREVVGYGIVLDPQGYVVTKASEFNKYKDLVVRVGRQKCASFQLIGIDDDTDVALIKVEAKELGALGATTGEATMGTVVVSNGVSTRAKRRAQIGVISATTREIPNTDIGYIGMTFKAPCSIEALIPGGPAEACGAKPGDEIYQVDETPIKVVNDLSQIIMKKKAGDKLTFYVRREGKEMSYVITLGSRRAVVGNLVPETANDEISGGHSERRDRFPMILQHDTPSQYTLMGGPLINLKGEVMGMNIARVNRAENYALPISLVLGTVEKIKKAAKQ